MSEIAFLLHFNHPIAVASDPARRPTHIEVARWPLPPPQVAPVVAEQSVKIGLSRGFRIRVRFEPLPVQARFATRTPAKSAGFMRVKFREWLFYFAARAGLDSLRDGAMIFLSIHR